MGAQVVSAAVCAVSAACSPHALCLVDMAPKKAMKAMKAAGKVLSKGGLADAIATETELKKKDCLKVLDSLAAVATAQAKSVGKVTIPGLVMVKAGQREVFGKVVFVKAKPAKTVVKAYCVAALRKSIWARARQPLCALIYGAAPSGRPA